VIASPELLIERARERTQLSDLGPDGWQEGLEHLVEAVGTDVGDDPATIASIEEILVGRLVTRLRIADWCAQHADEAGPPIEGPLVIVGLARTGTTALHYLLAADPRFRYLRRWEVADPVPPPDLASEAQDPRRAAQTRRSDVRHIATVDGPVEDGPIHGLHFRHGEAWLPVPSYTKWWRTADYTSAFRYHERFLRLLHSRRPPHYWLLKYPNYLFQLRDVVEQYPHTRFLFTHRDPVAALPSTCSTVLAARNQRVPTWSPDPDAFGREMLEYFVESMQRAIAARSIVGEHRFFDVGQHEIETRPVETAQRIYDFAGLELDDEVRGAMAQWAAENRRGSRGEHRYCAADFGLTDEGIREAFGDYLERFGAFC